MKALHLLSLATWALLLAPSMQQLQYYPWCDLTHSWHGCEQYIGDNVLLGAASDDLDVMPFQVISHPTPIAERLDEPHTTAEFAAYKSVAMVLVFKTDTRVGEVSLEEKTGNLNLAADWGGDVILWSRYTNISFDVETGCVLINGSLPKRSPCRQSSTNTGNHNEEVPVTGSFNSTACENKGASWWVDKVGSISAAVIIMSLASLAIGLIAGYIAGVRHEKRRLGVMYPDILADADSDAAAAL